MKNLLLILLMTISVTVNAADEWFFVSSTDKLNYDVKVGSVRIIKNNAGVPVVVGVGKVTNKANNEISFEQVYVTLSHCAAGYGSLVTVDLNGKVNYDNDFVFGGGTMASTISKFLCDIAQLQQQRAAGQTS